MPSVVYDLGYLRAGVAALESYLLSKELYWNLGAGSPPGEPAFPPLTLGYLLLSQARLHARQLDLPQRDELARLDEGLDDIRSRWRVAWERKAAQDFRARLNLWRDFLEEYREMPEANADRYAYEVRRRVMLHLLEPETLEINPAETGLLGGLDRVVESVLTPGDFVWERDLASGFPRDTYWYLFGRLKTKPG
jgi:hypothetical protein